MDRKMMCVFICILIVLGAVLYIVAQALESYEEHHSPSKQQMDAKRRGAIWCTQLAYLMGAVALLLILCCLCCRDVDFGSRHIKDDYE